MWSVLAIFNTITFPILQTALGYIIVKQVYKFFKLKYELQLARLDLCFVVGLLLHLVLSFFCKVLGAPWLIATYLPLIPILISYKDFPVIFNRFKPLPSANFLIYFFIVASIGLTLFSALDEIKTPWTNNYGDIAFHFGIISSFVFGENFPPQYLVFAGPNLSYPFFINFWSALLWWPASDNWMILSFIFFVQWTIVWILVYQFLSGWKYWLLPWCVLFGGGSYFIIGQYSHLSISKGYPWVVFLNSVWIPQRSYLLGLIFTLALIKVFYQGFKANEQFLFKNINSETRARIVLLSVLTGFSLLGHGHSIFIAALFIALVSLFYLTENYIKFRDRKYLIDFSYVTLLGIFCFLLTMSLVAPYVFGKASMIKFMAGWLVEQDNFKGIERVFQSIKMWISNAGYCLVFLLPVIVFGKYIREFIAISLLFIIFNIVNMAYWDWDQLKIFMAIYLIAIALWSYAEENQVWRLHFACIILVIPGILENFKVFQEGPSFAVYDVGKIMQAKQVISSTEKNAIIAAAPDHNNVVTLTGRRMFSGYAGTLWSHGLPYYEREKILKDFNQLIKCKEVSNDADRPYCPDYLVWGSAEKRFWQNVNPESFGLKPVVNGVLYRFD